ncbi:MAG: hypothetical protein QM820_00410 [Minicystis sp.]
MSEGAPQRVESKGIAYVHRRVALALGALSAACLLIPIGMVIDQQVRPRVPEVPLTAILDAFGQASLAAAVFACLALVVRFVPLASRGAVDRVGEHLIVETHGPYSRLRTLSARAGYLVPAGRAVRAEIHLENGDLLHVDAPDNETAEGVLRVAGVDAAQLRARIEMTEPLARTYAFVLLATVLGFVGLPVLFPLVRAIPALIGGPLWLFGVLLAARIAAAFTSLPEITVGTDGVSWQRGPVRRFIPLSEIASVRSQGPRLDFDLIGGRTVTLWSLTGAAPARASALELRVREALAARCGEIVSGHLDLLDRRGRSVAEWSASLAGLARAGSSYRAVGLSPDDLAAIVVSPDVTPERRLGAALALHAAGDPAAPDRIRNAAAQCASGRLRIALERVGDGAIDQEAIDEALAETELAERKVTRP